MTTYHEIAGTRRYEYRYYDDVPRMGAAFTGWMDGGEATPDMLERLIYSTRTSPFVEVREVVDMLDESGTHIGKLTFSELAYRRTQ